MGKHRKNRRNGIQNNPGVNIYEGPVIIGDHAIINNVVPDAEHQAPVSPPLIYEGDSLSQVSTPRSKSVQKITMFDLQIQLDFLNMYTQMLKLELEWMHLEAEINKIGKEIDGQFKIWNYAGNI